MDLCFRMRVGACVLLVPCRGGKRGAAAATGSKARGGGGGGRQQGLLEAFAATSQRAPTTQPSTAVTTGPSGDTGCGRLDRVRPLPRT
jgi:hypothetical protein